MLLKDGHELLAAFQVVARALVDLRDAEALSQAAMLAPRNTEKTSAVLEEPVVFYREDGMNENRRDF